MGKPTPSDPLGQQPDSTDRFMGAIREIVHQEIRLILRGRTGIDFDNLSDQMLAMELIARGWVAYKPSQDLKRV